MARKAAAGTGTIRKKSKTVNGKLYTWWEARYTTGYDPGTGKQIQRSISGNTQKEVAKKLKEATAALDAGTYIAPSKMSLGEWLDLWQANYLRSVKPSTVSSYQTTIKNHIKPSIGAIKLESLSVHDIQEFYNSRADAGLSPKTVKNIHGVLHKALQQAMLNGIIRNNPSDACVLPRIQKKAISPLNEEQITLFIKAIKGHRYEKMFLTALFTGIREGEVCGLQWNCVDFDNGKLLIDKQLQSLRKGIRGEHEKYALVPTKNSKGRSITAALQQFAAEG